MRYRTKQGFESIRAMEPDLTLKNIALTWKEKLYEGHLELTLTDEKSSVFLANEHTILRDMTGTHSEESIKAIHIGYPLGIIIPASKLNEKLLTAFLDQSVIPGSTQVKILFQNTCMLDYILHVLEELKEESCGRCVLCREAMKQLILIFEDAVNKRGKSDDIEIIKNICFSMKEGAFCTFGKAVGALLEHYIDDFSNEFEDHVKKKVCPAMVCKSYVSYVILPSKCKGCEECLDVCPCDAIEGKHGYIHMIDEYECSKCGKCLDVCEQEAVVTAGAVKPKVPTRLTRVGAWKRH